MKKALKITSLVFGIIEAVAAFVLLLIGIVFLAGAQGFAQAAADAASSADAEAVYVATLAAFTGTGTICLVFGILYVVGTILCFVLLGASKKPVASRGTLIALGVVSVIFGATVPGVVAIVYGAKDGQ